jgi:hypothetical protein
MPTIRVDDQVYAQLQRAAKPFVDTPNSVLRRLLGLEGPSDQPSDRQGQVGELLPLIEAGLLQTGDTLEWRRRSSTHHATVLEDGRLRLEDGRLFASPSAAGKALSGYEVNGWRSWGRSRDRVRLSALRDRL